MAGGNKLPAYINFIYGPFIPNVYSIGTIFRSAGPKLSDI